MKKIILLSTTALLLAACGQKSDSNSQGADSTSAAPVASVSRALSQPKAEPKAALPNDYSVDVGDSDATETSLIQVCIDVLQKWNDALNAGDAVAANHLYTGVVDYYGTCVEKDIVQQAQQKMFDKNAAFRQYIDNVELTACNSNRVYLAFDKHVQTEPGGEFKTYRAYVHFSGYETEWAICRESDTTTDANNGKRNNNLKSVQVQKHTALKDIFNAANVGKRIDTDYWTLVQSGEDDEDEGVLAAAMSKACDISARLQMSGELKRNYRGKKNTYYIDGLCEAGESESLLIWVYDASTGRLSCIY